jgi:hypothetical protein
MRSILIRVSDDIPLENLLAVLVSHAGKLAHGFGYDITSSLIGFTVENSGAGLQGQIAIDPLAGFRAFCTLAPE